MISWGALLSVMLCDVTSMVDDYEKWKPLDGVSKGEVKVGLNWLTALPAGMSLTDDNSYYILSVLVDRCENLLGSDHDDTSTSMQPRVELNITSSGSGNFKTNPKLNTENPVFEEGFLLECKRPLNEYLNIKVVDKDTTEGSLKIPIKFLIDSPNKEYLDKGWSLDGGHAEAEIFLSLKLYVVRSKEDRSMAALRGEPLLKGAVGTEKSTPFPSAAAQNE